MSCERYCAGLGCKARWTCDFGLLAPGAECPICSAARVAHAYAFDPLAARASTSGACPLCLPPCMERKRARGRTAATTERRRRPLVLTDHSHALSSFSAAARAWDVPMRDQHATPRPWKCPLCLHAWHEPLSVVLRRGSRLVNVCLACHGDVRWADLRSFAGAGPVGPAPWGALKWVASPFIHPESIYAHLRLGKASRGLDTETIEQRLGRMCPSALHRPPPWLRRSCASRAERVVRVWLDVVVTPAAQVFTEVSARIDGGCLSARFDFGFVCKADRSVRLIEIDGEQHFNTQAFGHSIGGARNMRRSQTRDRLKDSFVAGSAHLFLLRMSTTFVHDQQSDARRAMALWCRPSGHADRKIICLGKEYRPDLQNAIAAISPRAAAKAKTPLRTNVRTRDDVDLARIVASCAQSNSDDAVHAGPPNHRRRRSRST